MNSVEGLDGKRRDNSLAIVELKAKLLQLIKIG
jgi:hypothetical protein